MAASGDHSSFNVPLLIEEVQRRPALWDHAHPHRHNRSVVDVLWEEVARPFGVPADSARRKWKGLRDTFRKELRKYPNGFEEDVPVDAHKWLFFRQLYFLKGQMRARNRYDTPNSHYLSDISNGLTKEEGGGGEEEENSCGVDIIDMDSEACDPIGDLGLQNLKDQVGDEDYHFFMSLLPHVQKLQPLQKLELRAKIQELVCREVYGTKRHNQPANSEEVCQDPLL